MTDLNPLLGRRDALRRLSLLLGGVATAPLAPALLSGCRTPAGDELASYTYATLDADQQSLLSALVDQILPATDTPGASDVGVPQFIDMMLSEWYAAEERDGFLAGLAALDARAGGGSFAALDADAQAALVRQLDAETFAERPSGSEATADRDAATADEDVAGVAVEGTSAIDEQTENEVAGMQGDLGEAQSDDPEATREVDELGNEVDDSGASTPGDGPPFFRQLKELTVAGYYTSEAGATEELQWLAAPGRYDADVPLAEVGRAWA